MQNFPPSCTACGGSGSLAVPRDRPRSLQVPCDRWRLLAIACGRWWSLAVAGGCSRLLAIAGRLLRSLAVARDCLRPQAVDRGRSRSLLGAVCCARRMRLLTALPFVFPRGAPALPDLGRPFPTVSLAGCPLGWGVAQWAGARSAPAACGGPSGVPVGRGRTLCPCALSLTVPPDLPATG